MIRGCAFLALVAVAANAAALAAPVTAHYGAVRIAWVAAGLVALGQTHGGAHTLLSLNPLTAIFESYRDVLLYGQSPAAWELLYPVAFALLLLGVFTRLYKREESQFAKVIE